MSNIEGGRHTGNPREPGPEHIFVECMQRLESIFMYIYVDMYIWYVDCVYMEGGRYTREESWEYNKSSFGANKHTWRVAELLGLEIHTKTRECVYGRYIYGNPRTIVQQCVYGGWQIYSRSRGPAALAWETEAMLTCTCHCPHQSIHSPHQSIHTSLSTPGKLNIRAVVPVQVPEWFLRLQPKPIYTRVLCTSMIMVVRIYRVYSVDWTIGCTYCASR